ncbi:MAG: exodeoxyribonuclease VII large subunit [Rhizobiales bacterium]|nr:exodeoxyribonuclease VII large subunit [Hyphomicrobiales bacterium]
MSTSPSEAGRAAGNVMEVTVSELARELRRVIEGSFDRVRVRGEVGRVSRPGSGHLYFDLKDDSAVLAAVVWKGVASGLKIQPEQGLEVIATGRLTIFPGQSRYQMIVEAIEPAGVGALMALLEERKRVLGAEGLFAEERKKPLPFLPRVVGIVTSPSGAVIRDMLHGFMERFPIHVLVWPVRVQGETSAAEVARAVRGFNAIVPGGAIARPDVLIVARGGGSIEDLWGFNEEIVVRAVAESRIPVISAVGHETDWTLIDLVADARAPTPTKAAEWAVPKRLELIERIGELEQRRRGAQVRHLAGLRTRLVAAARGLPRPVDLVALARQRLDTAATRLERGLIAGAGRHANRLARVAGRLQPVLLAQRLSAARQRVAALERTRLGGLARTLQTHRGRLDRVTARLDPKALNVRVAHLDERLIALDARGKRAFAGFLAQSRRQLEANGKLLESLSYQGVLARGYAVVRNASGVPVARVAGIGEGDRLEIELADGRIGAVAEGPTGGSGEGTGQGREVAERGPTAATKRSRRERKPEPDDQGQLF